MNDLACWFLVFGRGFNYFAGHSNDLAQWFLWFAPGLDSLAADFCYLVPVSIHLLLIWMILRRQLDYLMPVSILWPLVWMIWLADFCYLLPVSIFCTLIWIVMLFAPPLDYLLQSFLLFDRSLGSFRPIHFDYLRLLSNHLVGHLANSELNGSTQGFALEQGEKDQGCTLQKNLRKRRRKSCMHEIKLRIVKMKLRDWRNGKSQNSELILYQKSTFWVCHSNFERM
jgi:hypothetical protein